MKTEEEIKIYTEKVAEIDGIIRSARKKVIEFAHEYNQRDIGKVVGEQLEGVRMTFVQFTRYASERVRVHLNDMKERASEKEKQQTKDMYDKYINREDY